MPLVTSKLPLPLGEGRVRVPWRSNSKTPVIRPAFFVCGRFTNRRVGIAHHSCVAWKNGGQCPPYAANEYRTVCRTIAAQNRAILERQRVLQFAFRRARPLTSCGAMVNILQSGYGSHETRCKTSEFRRVTAHTNAWPVSAFDVVDSAKLDPVLQFEQLVESPIPGGEKRKPDAGMHLRH